MFKKILTIPVILFVLVLAMSGCSSQGKDATPTTPAAKASLPEPPTPKPVVHTSLAGDWTAVNSTKDGGMAATIDDTGIVINWTGPDTTALYWKGTFPMSAGNETIVSKGDTKAMDASVMAESLMDNKPFTIKDGKIIFDVSMMGVTKRVTLVKD